MYANGLTAREIADELFIAHGTAANTLKAAREKLEGKSMANAVALAMAYGYLTIDMDGNIRPAESLRMAVPRQSRS
jgi:predicted transcriptional regulator